MVARAARRGADRTKPPVEIDRVEMATGRREPWKTLQPRDVVGIDNIHPIVLTPDGKSYCCSQPATCQTWKVVDGVKTPSNLPAGYGHLVCRGSRRSRRIQAGLRPSFSIVERAPNDNWTSTPFAAIDAGSPGAAARFSTLRRPECPRHCRAHSGPR